MALRERTDATIARARDGDRTALAELYRRLHPPILRYLGALEPAEAEDLASEVWLGVIANLDRFAGDERGLRAWTFTIARSRMTDLRRRRARRATVPASLEELEEHAGRRDVEEEALAALGTERALARIAALPRDQAEVILLRVLGDLSVRDVAAIVRKRPGTVRVLQHRGLRRLAEREEGPAARQGD
jgi:RNA polymerase sigma-70 factor (ECF subfamily)